MCDRSHSSGHVDLVNTATRGRHRSTEEPHPNLFSFKSASSRMKDYTERGLFTIIYFIVIEFITLCRSTESDSHVGLLMGFIHNKKKNTRVVFFDPCGVLRVEQRFLLKRTFSHSGGVGGRGGRRVPALLWTLKRLRDVAPGNRRRKQLLCDTSRVKVFLCTFMRSSSSRATAAGPQTAG